MAGRRTVAKAKPITRSQVRSYDYVPNPGVRTLVAVNGRGAYRSARAEMTGLSTAARRRRARQLTQRERQSFAKKVQEKSMKRNAARVRTALAGRRRMRTNRKAPSPAQLRARAAFARMAKARAAAARAGSPAPRRPKRTRRTSSRRRMRRNTSVQVPASGWDRIYGAGAKRRRARAATKGRKLTKAERREIALKNLAKARAAKKRKATRKTAIKSKAGRSAVRKALQYGGISARATGRRHKRYKHGRKLTKAERKAIAIQNLRKAWAKKGAKVKLAANRRRRTSSRRRPQRRRTRQTAAQKRASLANLRKARASLKRRGMRKNPSRRRRLSTNRRRRTRRLSTNRRRMASNRRRKTTRRVGKRRQTAAQRRASLANLRKARSKLRSRRTRRAKGYTTNRRRRARRSMRRNYRRSYRRNDAMALMKMALPIAGGLLAHKVVMAGIDALILKPMFAPAPAPAAAPAATGALGPSAQPIVSNLASIALAALGVVATKYAVKDRETANLICGGIVVSALHKVVVTVLSQVAPATAGYLSGMDDGTAARLSAMYGFGAVSLQPMYQPTNGFGEYFNGPMGEFFESSLQGPLSEYFDSGTEGLGNYGANPDLYQAAAGYGSVAFGEENVSNHILPNSDLDAQLTIAEAAAGVGSAYEAAAGYGASPYEAAAGYGEYLQGFGANDVPASSTWIPGESNGQLWAAVRPVTRGQQATAMVPGGILETRGGAGIFG